MKRTGFHDFLLSKSLSFKNALAVGRRPAYGVMAVASENYHYYGDVGP